MERMEEASIDIKWEAHNASQKHKPFNSLHEAYAVLLEEVDEFWYEVKHGTRERAMEEVTQVGAMALRILTEFGGA